jgi:PKD repeat protein
MAKKIFRLPYLLFISILFISALIPLRSASAAEVTLAWEPGVGEIDGYLLHWGTSSGVYPNSIDVGNVTQYTVTGLQEGVTYYFVIQAYNEYGKSPNSNEVQWVASSGDPPNEPPTAEISATPTSGNAPLLVSFNGNGQDSDGTIVSWEWDFGDGERSTYQNPTHVYQEVESAVTYTVILTVTDDDGATGQDTISLTVSPGGSPPDPPTNVTVEYD